MSSQLDNTLDIARQFAQQSLEKLPEPAQNVVRAPLAQKALALLLALGILRATNSYLTKWATNNWQRAQPWKADKELVLITGGCGGIGRQIMEDLAKTGTRVVILDIVEPKFKLPSNVSFYKSDITSTANVKEVGDQIRKNHGDPTVLINNAGVGLDGTIVDEPEEKIRTTFEVNTMSHWWMVKEFLPSMIKNNHGHVITIASMASFVALGEMADYCGTKASAMAFHESLTQELRYWYNAPKVRTSIIHPMWVQTQMIKQLTEAKFNQPVMTTETVSNAVIKQILTQSSGQVILPTNLSHFRLVRAFPYWLQEIARGIGSAPLKKMRDANPYSPN